MVPRALLAGVAAAVVVLALGLVGALEPFELGALNRLFELRGVRAPASPVVIVAIDDDTFDELNMQWPFPRSVHARLVDVLREAGASVIAFDVLFPEPSVLGPEDDAAFGEAVATAGNVVLGAAITVVSERFYTKVDLNPPLPVIRRGAAGVGAVNHTVDPDGHLRRALLEHRIGDDMTPAWDVAVYRTAVARGVPAAPLRGTREILINFRGGPRTFGWVPYHRVVGGEVPPEAFRGKIVLIGGTSQTLQDLFSTPFARAREMPGVEVHANIIDTLLRGRPIREVPATISLALALLAALAGAWIATRWRVTGGAVAVLALWVALAVSVLALFAADVWFRGIGITLAIAFGYGGAVLDAYVREQRDRRRLSQFFSPAVLKEVVAQRHDVSLGSSRRLVTVFFSDIRGFTSISERIAPEQVAEMLREYLTEMTEVVFRHGGTVDKYIGDCIMALYNAPLEDPQHAVAAVRTALELQERTLAVSARWEQALGVEIRNGVGINTGEAVVGTMGSRQRLEYTAIGDTVNIAARLESLTKDYGVPIIISESTYALVRGRFLTRELGAVSVKGKAQPVRVYTVLPSDLRRHPRAALAAAASLLAIGNGEVCAVEARDVAAGGLGLGGVP
ncbi:MAG: adenylate/guanylate cyclase domain-containing protein, partial [Candidatus Rokubacteria bacterium]|nr:adenylate/guanylate cyclase domain-containing protein [Candidatus Rokubacteria bacterium]